MTEKLYEASQAGVDIDLIIRGQCSLKPGIPDSATGSGCGRSSAATSNIPRLPLRERQRPGRAGDLHRVRRPDEPQPQPAGRGTRPSRRPPHPAARREILDVVLDDDRLAWTLAGDGVWTKRAAPPRSTPMLDCSSWPEVVRMGKATESLLSGHPEIEVWAAGGAVWRTVDGHVELLLVRRESHKDWTMPRESSTRGDPASLCPSRGRGGDRSPLCHRDRLSLVTYTDGRGRSKAVVYWTMTVAEGAFVPNRGRCRRLVRPRIRPGDPQLSTRCRPGGRNRDGHHVVYDHAVSQDGWRPMRSPNRTSEAPRRSSSRRSCDSLAPMRSGRHPMPRSPSPWPVRSSSRSARRLRGRVALYLALTMAPFAIVAPLLGPAIDRAKGDVA